MLFVMALYAFAAFGSYRPSFSLFFGGYLLCLISHLNVHDYYHFQPDTGSFAGWVLLAEKMVQTAALLLCIRKAKHQDQQIRALQENQQKENRVDEIRNEIAQNLHDELGSQLCAISLLSQTTSRLTDKDLIQQRLNTIGQTARQVTEAMRVIVWSLNSSSNSLQHISQRIQETALGLFSDCRTQLHIDCTPTDQPSALSHRQKQELHRIAQECLTNVFRHARAQNVWMQLQETPAGLLFTLRDDGVGFNRNRTGSGLGLSGMRQRASQIGASLSIESAPAEGTIIVLRIPTKTVPELPARCEPPSLHLQTTD